MNNPSPLVPQGSLQQNAKSRSYVKMAFFTVVAIHIVFFGGLLFQGCKKKTADTDNFAASQTNVDSSSLNVTPPMTGTDSNLVNPTSLGNAPAGGIGLAGSNQYVAPVVPVVEPPPAAPAHPVL